MKGSKVRPLLAIHYNHETIAFALVRSRTNRLTITVHPNLTITVKAPRQKSLREIRARVERRAAWIARQLQHFHQFPPAVPTRRYVSGETHLYLGRQYRLKLHLHRYDYVKLIGRYLHVYTPDPNLAERVRMLVQTWYQERANELLPRRVHQCHAGVKSFGIPLPIVRLRRMHNRWGSCTPKRTILLNTQLIQAPPSCIDYVVVHELCHLRFHTHTKTFFRFLTTCMPDWQTRKRQLDLLVLPSS